MKGVNRVLCFMAAAIFLVLQMNIAQTNSTESTLQKAKALYQSIERFDVHPGNGTPRSVRGILAKNVNLNDPTQVKQFLHNSKSVFRINEISDDFITKEVVKDELNMKFVKLGQTYKGVQVFGSELIVHSNASNTIFEVNGRFTPDLNIDITPGITSQNALNIALANLGPAEYRWQNPEEEKILKDVYQDLNRTWQPKPELVIAPRDGDFNKGKYLLTWKMVIAVDGAKMGNWMYFVDAKTGEIIHKFNSMPDAVGTGISNYNGIVPINTLNTATYLMIDEIRNISTFNYNGSFPGTLLADADNYWNQNNAAVDAHWGIEQVYDFYNTVFNRKSFDNAGAKIINTVNVTSDPNNGGWTGSQIIYGAGDGIESSSITSLDCCGHEFTHAVTQFTAGLSYFGESGALNEAFSDIMATAIEFEKTPTKANWTIGEDSYTPGISGDALRHMDNPNIGDPDQCHKSNPSQPDTYLGEYWASTSGCDRGGVHINSGVLNFAFYLMTKGGSGMNDFEVPYNVTGIGIIKTRAIAYKALAGGYLQASSQYVDARNAFLSAALDLGYGPTSLEYKAVNDAFSAVGVGVLLEVKNSFDAGTIKVNGATKNSGFTYYATNGETQTYEAIPQYSEPYNRVWNTSGAKESISNWKKQRYQWPEEQIIGATNISLSFTVYYPSNDRDTYIADLKSQYNISLSKGIRIDGGNSGTYKVNDSNVGASYTSTIVEGNSLKIEAVPSSGDVFFRWSDGNTTNPYYPPAGNVALTAQYKGIQKSSSASAFSNNSQRKLVTTTNGWLHQVYESGGRVWLEHKSPTGTWQLNFNPYTNAISPVDNGEGKCPSIDYYGNTVVVVYQQKNGNNYQICVSTFYPSQDGTKYFTGMTGTSIYPYYGGETSDAYSVNANPNISWAANLMLVVTFERKGTQPGIYYITAGLNSDGLSLWTEPSDITSINTTNANSTNASISNAFIPPPSNVVRLAVAWEQVSSSTISSIKSCCLFYDNNSYNIYQYPSTPYDVSNSTYKKNTKPSVVILSDASVRVGWIGDMSGSGDPYTVYALIRDPLQPVFNSYGLNIKSISLNKIDNSSTYYAAFSKYWSNKWTNYALKGGSTSGTKTLNTAGSDVQLSNGSSKANMFVSSFYTSGSPYYFKTSQSLGASGLSKIGSAQIAYRRGVTIGKGDLQFYYSFGNLFVDGNSIEFIDITNSPGLCMLDSLNTLALPLQEAIRRRIERKLYYPSVDTLNTVLLTEPFSITGSSDVAFDERAGFLDSSSAIKALGNNGYIAYKLELVDYNTNKSIGTIKESKFNSVSLNSYGLSSSSLNTNKVGTKTVRVKITISTNINGLQGALVNEYLDASDGALTKPTVNKITLQSPGIITQYALEQNYPNPFNPTSVISYQLSAVSNVSLKVYDVLGREVATLVDGMKEAGSYTAIFDGARLSSGIYFTRMTATPQDGTTPFTKTMKMMLMK